MANVLTQNNILDIFESIQVRHPSLNSFFVGKEWDFTQSEQQLYPAVQVYFEAPYMPEGAGTYGTGTYPMIIHPLRVNIITQSNDDNSSDRYIYSDVAQYLQDCVNEISTNPYYVRSNTQLTGDIQFEELEEYTQNNLAGYSALIRFKLINYNSPCGLPLEEIPGFDFPGAVSTGYSYSRIYLTCGNLTACTSFQDYIANALAGVSTTKVQPGLNTYTGGTSSAPTVNISAATLNYLSAGTITATTIHTPFIYGDNLNITTTTSLNGVSSLVSLQGGAVNDYSKSWFYQDTNESSFGYAGNYMQFTSGNFKLFNNYKEVLSIISNYVVLGHLTGSSLGINLTNNQTIFVSVDGKGIQYNADYSAGYTSRSLVDKAYVDANAGATQTLLQPGLNTYTGGTTTNPTVNISAATLSSLSAATINSTSVNPFQIVFTNTSSIFTGSTGMTFNENKLSLSGTQSDNILFQIGSGMLFYDRYNGFAARNGAIIGGVNINNAGNTSQIAATAGDVNLTNYYGAFNVTSINGFKVTTGGLISNSISATTFSAGTLSIASSSVLTTINANSNTFSLSRGGVVGLSLNDSNYTDLTQSNGVRITGQVKIGGGANPIYPLDVIGRINSSSLSATTISGGTFFSGSTPLQTIIQNLAVGGSTTLLQPGLNTYTGGTSNAPTVNVSAATLNFLSAGTITATTINTNSVRPGRIAYVNALSGLTGTTDLVFDNTLGSGTISRLQVGDSAGYGQLDLAGYGELLRIESGVDAYFTNSNGGFVFRPAFVEKMRLTSTGLGIGKTPTQLLDVGGRTNTNELSATTVTATTINASAATLVSLSANTITGTTVTAGSVLTDSVNGTNNSTIIGGSANAFVGTKFNSVFIGGASNTINGGFLSNIFGGANNRIQSQSQETIINGNGNIITASTPSAFVNNTTIGGTNTRIYDSIGSVIIAGNNVELSGGSNTTIIGCVNLSANTPNTVFVPDLFSTGNISGSTFYSGSTNLETVISRKDISAITTSFGNSTITYNDSSINVWSGGFQTFQMNSNITQTNTAVTSTVAFMTVSNIPAGTYNVQGFFNVGCSSTGGMKFQVYSTAINPAPNLIINGQGTATTCITDRIASFSANTTSNYCILNSANAWLNVNGKLTITATTTISLRVVANVQGQTSTIYSGASYFNIWKYN